MRRGIGPARAVRGAEGMNKGAWRMPWLKEAMKDAASCENPRVGASGL